MLSASRSAAAPDLPTAMTMRPQFGSSPAMAVLTSGELAMASAWVRASASSRAPVTFTVTNLVAPSPSFTTWCARSRKTVSSASAKALSAAVTSTPEAPVAPISSVSEVEVSLSTVMQLKLRSLISETSACRSPRLIFASVKM